MGCWVFLLLLFGFGGVLCMCFSYKKGKPNASFFPLKEDIRIAELFFFLSLRQELSSVPSVAK